LAARSNHVIKEAETKKQRNKETKKQRNKETKGCWIYISRTKITRLGH
jgi:hypothetical protein